jgi:hypothetical protein
MTKRTKTICKSGYKLTSGSVEVENMKVYRLTTGNQTSSLELSGQVS